MSEFKPLCLLFLFHLANNDSSVWLKDIKPKGIKPSDRKALKSKGLIEEAKEEIPNRPRKTFGLKINLTEAGWRYLGDHLTDPVNAKTYAAGEIFGEFLAHLSEFLKNRRTPLAEIFSPPATEIGEDPSLSEATDIVMNVLKTIRSTTYRPEVGLRLYELRPLLTDLSWKIQDEAILKLQKQSYFDLVDLRQDTTVMNIADEVTALRVDGQVRHLILLNF
jgi:hypothetical protein